MGENRSSWAGSQTNKDYGCTNPREGNFSQQHPDVKSEVSSSQQYRNEHSGERPQSHNTGFTGSGMTTQYPQNLHDQEYPEYDQQSGRSQFTSPHTSEDLTRQHNQGDTTERQVIPGQTLPENQAANTATTVSAGGLGKTTSRQVSQTDNPGMNYSKTVPTISNNHSKPPIVNQAEVELQRHSETSTGLGQQQYNMRETASIIDQKDDRDGANHGIQQGRGEIVHVADSAVQTDSISVRTVMVQLPIVEELKTKHSHCYSQEEYTTLMDQWRQVLDSTLNRHEQEMNAMKHHYKQQVDDLSERLSTEMNSKISSNETAIENISIKNRPSKIAEEYADHCTSQWLEAKQYLDDKFPKGHNCIKFKFLCQVLQFSAEVASYLQKQSENKILKHFSDPLNMSESPITGEVKEQLPLEMKNATSDLLRMMAGKVDVKPIVKGIQLKMLEKWPGLQSFIYGDANISPYIERTAQLAWKMVNQRPVMSFHVTGLKERMVDTYQEPQWGSSDPNDPRSVVACYVYPVLSHGDKILVKGKVYLQKAETGVQ